MRGGSVLGPLIKQLSQEALVPLPGRLAARRDPVVASRVGGLRNTRHPGSLLSMTSSQQSALLVTTEVFTWSDLSKFARSLPGNVRQSRAWMLTWAQVANL
ncbi:hypothetical protein MTO96_033081 [Rhipicephalus appendiculatus]